MCLIVLAWRLVPGMPLLVAANRDEFYERPAQAAHWWPDAPQILAGRDLRSGGTWMGLQADPQHNTPARKFAAVTNVRAPSEFRADAHSRGDLVSEFLRNDMSAEAYLHSLKSKGDLYNGFNLLLYDGQDLIWHSNRYQDDARNGKPLAPGIYGVSNAALDSCWHKVVRTKAEFCSLLCQLAPEDAFFEMLGNTNPAPDCRLPDTGIPFDRERLLSSPCIVSEDYGTRVSSLVRIFDDRAPQLIEKVLR